MSVLEDKKIIIRIPSLTMRSFLSLRFGFALVFMFCLGLFGYWYQAIRPFLWVPMAHVDSFSCAISSDFSGKITIAGPEEGSFVRKGDLLMAVDTDRNLSRMNELEMQMTSLQEQIGTEKEKMEISMQEYLTASSENDLGIGPSDLAEKHLAEFEQAQLRSEQATAQILENKRELARMEEKKLFAPFDAIVLKKGKNTGEQVSLGEPVFLLSDPRQTWVEAYVPEEELGRVQVDMPARIRLAAFPDREFQGKIAWISPATISKISSQPISGQKEKVAVKITLERDGATLKPGLSAEVGLKVR